MAYALWMKQATLYREQVEAMEKVDARIRGLINQAETGLPPIAALVPPLNDESADA